MFKILLICRDYKVEWEKCRLEKLSLKEEKPESTSKDKGNFVNL